MLIFIQIVEVVILIILSVNSDMQRYKIKNTIILPLTGIGFSTNILANGMEGLNFSLIGWFAPVGILYVLYCFRMLGAGDIKLFGAIGSIMGVSFVIDTLLSSFLLGGCISIVLMFLRKNFLPRMKEFLTYSFLCIKNLRVIPYYNFSQLPSQAKFHFSYAIAAAVFVLIIHLFLKGERLQYVSVF